MKLSRLGEFGLIEIVRRSTPKGQGVLLGIGDDAAWVKSRFGSLLITSDLLIEGIHFDLRWTSFFALGCKSLAVNLSDIAAMGGKPAYLLLSLGIPKDFDSADIKEFYRGINWMASKSGVALVGGDTSAAAALYVSVCLIGHAPYRPVSRRGARIGDDIYVTGTLGDAALALQLLRSKSPRPRRGHVAYLLSRHHQPTPRIMAGALLARRGLATAMIDVSDGLLQDLSQLCKASGIGAVIWQERLPVSRAYRTLAGTNRMRWALTGGEDYELLFCARSRNRRRIEKLQLQANVSITHIGTCVPSRDGINVRNHADKPSAKKLQGYDHFKEG